MTSPQLEAGSQTTRTRTLEQRTQVNSSLRLQAKAKFTRGEAMVGSGREAEVIEKGGVLVRGRQRRVPGRVAAETAARESDAGVTRTVVTVVNRTPKAGRCPIGQEGVTVVPILSRETDSEEATLARVCSNLLLMLLFRSLLLWYSTRTTPVEPKPRNRKPVPAPLARSISPDTLSLREQGQKRAQGR